VAGKGRKASPERTAERFVKHRDGPGEEGLQGPSIPSHLLLLDHVLRISLTALSTKARHAGAVHQHVAINRKVFDEIADMPSGGNCAAHVADVNVVKPVRQFRRAPETGTRTSVPELPLGAFEIANWIDVGVSAGRTCAQAARRLQGVLKAHRDVPPIEDERRLRVLLETLFRRRGSAKIGSVERGPNDEKKSQNEFGGRHFTADVILWAVRW